MAEVTPASIDVDISKLRSSIRMNVKSIRGYQQAIKDKRREQESLKRLVESPGKYSIEALKKNVKACDNHIVEFEATIQRERMAMDEYNRIIKVLEDKKCQLEMTLQ